MKKFAQVLLPFAFAGFIACSSLPLKQQAVTGLQASELALESAQNTERAICFVTPATEKGTHCTNPLAAQLKLTDAVHVAIANGFVIAFDAEIKAATALKAWQAGQPAPTDVISYQTDISGILTLTQTLAPGASNLVAQAQSAVDQAAATLKALGVK
jgi:hypothetical protein